MTFRGGPNLLSVIVTRKRDGEALGNRGPEVLDGYSIAGAETAGFLIYAVSDLPDPLNRDTLQAIVPSLRTVLDHLTA